jgi:hypothetical protein
MATIEEWRQKQAAEQSVAKAAFEALCREAQVKASIEREAREREAFRLGHASVQNYDSACSHCAEAEKEHEKLVSQQASRDSELAAASSAAAEAAEAVAEAAVRLEAARAAMLAPGTVVR